MAKAKVRGPFTTTDVENWNAALRQCAQIRQECELAISAGFPCQEQLQACQALEAQLTQMKSTYAPHLP